MYSHSGCYDEPWWDHEEYKARGPFFKRGSCEFLPQQTRLQTHSTTRKSTGGASAKNKRINKTINGATKSKKTKNVNNPTLERMAKHKKRAEIYQISLTLTLGTPLKGCNLALQHNR